MDQILDFLTKFYISDQFFYNFGQSSQFPWTLFKMLTKFHSFDRISITRQYRQYRQYRQCRHCRHCRQCRQCRQCRPRVEAWEGRWGAIEQSLERWWHHTQSLSHPIPKMAQSGLIWVYQFSTASPRWSKCEKLKYITTHLGGWLECMLLQGTSHRYIALSSKADQPWL